MRPPQGVSGNLQHTTTTTPQNSYPGANLTLVPVIQAASLTGPRLRKAPRSTRCRCNHQALRSTATRLPRTISRQRIRFPGTIRSRREMAMETIKLGDNLPLEPIADEQDCKVLESQVQRNRVYRLHPLKVRKHRIYRNN